MNYQLPSSYVELLYKPDPPAIVEVIKTYPQPVDNLQPREGWLVIPKLGMAQPVGSYNVCGHTEWNVPAGVTRWSCVSDVWLLGHSPGVFSAIPQLQVGDILYYGLQKYHVTGKVVVHLGDKLYPPPLILQTCLAADASSILLVEASP
jgi:hypothetical protein